MNALTQPTLRAWRRSFLAVTMISALLRVTAAEEPSWVAQAVTPPPAAKIDDSQTLQTAAGAEIDSLDAWKEKRAAIAADWRKFLGAYAYPDLPLEIETLETERLEHCTRTLIRYQAEPGRRVRAYLLVPHQSTSKKMPAIVAFHGTNAKTFQKLVGLDAEPERHIGLRLVEQGFVVLCPENYLWEKESYLASTAAALKPHPESKGMAVMLADGVRAVDVLLAQKNVDPQRIGAYGHSLGAKETLYLMALDDRVCAGVASEGGIGMFSTNWEAPWYLGPVVKSDGFIRRHDDLIALIAPRPFLVLGGEQGPGCADGERSWPELLVGQRVAALYGEPVRIGLWNHHEGHKLSLDSGARVIAWLNAYVADKP
ncbi:dienelactone hydrolase family protein [Blastopirellula sp. JC732]|uniref:Dienelactone hydrolase family protein n=1 Tax=Blastopirellula sediminis TaxID=2894196 RepID=A0A9X1MJZ4_9BACT|nr:dienelactone hydrolase family protein [Blastopirellula sediminis]MCC9608675.1 dienelactone hydrolase family protein [Blastopirellula sediminis]MCC9628548.1 dienelactone hydrolase family protein [Blastopirellula sediminis]